MKIFNIICFVAILNFANIENVQAVIKLNSQQDSITLKAKRLKYLYLLSTSSSNGIRDTYQEQFFKEFPNTFGQLLELYGYNEKDKKPNILYNEAPNHILNLFNNLLNINDTLYYKKIIQISIGGHWDADAVNYFQDGLQKRVLDNPKLTLHLLKQITNDKIKSFWYFYFDSPHPQNQIPEQLQKIKSIDNKIYYLMLEAQNEEIRDSKE